MQVILLDKVINLGALGDIVKVKDGYARNFLIPSGRARRATEANKAEFAAKRAELEKAAAAKLAEAQAQGEKLAGLLEAIADRRENTEPPLCGPTCPGRTCGLCGGRPTRAMRRAACACCWWKTTSGWPR